MKQTPTPTANNEWTPRKSRNPWPVLAVTLTVVMILGLLPAPFVIERPGPVLNTLGDIQIEEDPQPVMEISGAKTYPPEGVLNLLTVTLRGTPERRNTWGSLLVPLLDPAQDIYPLSDVYPPGQTAEQREAETTMQMTSSQDVSSAAALRYLDYTVPSTTTVGSVYAEFPAAGVLQEGDVLLEIDGQHITGVETLHEVVAAKPGRSVELTFERDSEGTTKRITETLKPQEVQPGTWLLGVAVATEYDMPVDISFAVNEIGGPSAGMIFALAIIDQLTPGELTGGHIVSGTGTVDASGKVGEIGGLVQKMHAAADEGSDLFLMPRGNCSDAPKSVPGGMTVAVVDDLDEAVQAIERFGNKQAVPGLESCAQT